MPYQESGVRISGEKWADDENAWRGLEATVHTQPCIRTRCLDEAVAEHLTDQLSAGYGHALEANCANDDAVALLEGLLPAIVIDCCDTKAPSFRSTIDVPAGPETHDPRLDQGFEYVHGVT